MTAGAGWRRRDRPRQARGAQPRPTTRLIRVLRKLGRPAAARRGRAGAAWAAYILLTQRVGDAVTGLGDYLELELIATKDEVPAAQARVEALAAELGCGSPEPRSYLDMLLAK